MPAAAPDEPPAGDDPPNRAPPRRGRRTTRVKICGLNDEASVDAVAAGRADYAGFVFFPPSPRVVSAEYAADLAARLPAGIHRVGLFVAPSQAHVAAVLRAVHLDVLQLYSAAGPADRWRAWFGAEIWTAHGISRADDLPDDADGADALVIEAKPPPEATRPGGNALRFDWTLLPGWRAPAPWLLAGGLTPENVADGIAASGARGVDVSSGVETAPGVKDPARIAAFISRARAAFAAGQ